MTKNCPHFVVYQRRLNYPEDKKTFVKVSRAEQKNVSFANEVLRNRGSPFAYATENHGPSSADAALGLGASNLARSSVPIRVMRGLDSPLALCAAVLKPHSHR